MTPYPGQEWMEQQARNATMEEWGFLSGCRYLLHDRDTKFCASFRELIESGSIKTKQRYSALRLHRYQHASHDKLRSIAPGIRRQVSLLLHRRVA
jgi:hypothetical protein